MQQKNQHYSIYLSQTHIKFKIQLKIIYKIISSQLWIQGNNFPLILIYHISKYLFRNPLKLKQTVYTIHTINILQLNQKYLITSNLSTNQIDKYIKNTNVLNNKSNERSAYITITKKWKAIDFNHHSYAQIIAKGKFFLNFFSNISLKLYLQENVELDPIKNYSGFQKQQKDKIKDHYLISDNHNTIYKQFEQIFQYEKDKKISDLIIKIFVNLMNKNIVIVKIEQNYYTKQLGCQGKYVYIENKNELPLIKLENISEDKEIKYNNYYPWIYINQYGQWCIGNNHSINLYTQYRYPYKRQKKQIVNKKMDYYLQQDIWINKI